MPGCSRRGTVKPVNTARVDALTWHDFVPARQRGIGRGDTYRCRTLRPRGHVTIYASPGGSKAHLDPVRCPALTRHRERYAAAITEENRERATRATITGYDDSFYSHTTTVGDAISDDATSWCRKCAWEAITDAAITAWTPADDTPVPYTFTSATPSEIGTPAGSSDTANQRLRRIAARHGLHTTGSASGEAVYGLIHPRATDTLRHLATGYLLHTRDLDQRLLATAWTFHASGDTFTEALNKAHLVYA